MCANAAQERSQMDAERENRSSNHDVRSDTQFERGIFRKPETFLRDRKGWRVLS